MQGLCVQASTARAALPTTSAAAFARLAITVSDPLISRQRFAPAFPVLTLICCWRLGKVAPPRAPAANARASAPRFALFPCGPDLWFGRLTASALTHAGQLLQSLADAAVHPWHSVPLPRCVRASLCGSIHLSLRLGSPATRLVSGAAGKYNSLTGISSASQCTFCGGGTYCPSGATFPKACEQRARAIVECWADLVSRSLVGLSARPGRQVSMSWCSHRICSCRRLFCFVCGRYNNQNGMSSLSDCPDVPGESPAL